MWKTIILLVVEHGYQTCFLDFEKELDTIETCGNAMPGILNPNKEENKEDILPLNLKIRPRPVPCAHTPIHNSINIYHLTS
jgi:hypothetical protein